MSSQSKIDANRANAQKSTGPRTAEGKAKSSRNSTVHAFTSESPLLPDEDPADLQTLCDAYFADLSPEGQAEEDLVERIAVAQYRLRRVPLLEAGFFDLRLRMRPLPECHNQDGKAKLMSWAYQTDCGANNTLDKLGRYEGRFQREITRCFNDLHKLRAERRKAAPAPPAPDTPPPGRKQNNKTNPKPPATPVFAGASENPTAPIQAPSAPTSPQVPATPPPDGEKNAL